MKIAVANICMPDYSRLGEVTHPLWRDYCRKHGYDWHSVSEPITGRGVSWDKLALVQRLLCDYEFVLWVGTDTLVTNSEQKIEDYYAQYEPASVLIAADVLGLNSDVMVFKRSPWSEMFLYAVLDIGYILFRDHRWSEQEAIIRLAHQAPYAPHVTIVPQKGFNSYLHELYGRPSNWPGNWSPGDWILHLPGLSLERRLDICQRYASLAT